ncbi:hypothetical protein oki184_08820 [Helicobacter pylori]
MKRILWLALILFFSPLFANAQETQETKETKSQTRFNISTTKVIEKEFSQSRRYYALDLKSNGDYNAYYNAFNDKITIQITQLETLSALNSAYLSLQNLKGLE